MLQTTTTQEDFLALSVDGHNVHCFDPGQTIEGIAHIEHGRELDQEMATTAAQRRGKGADIGLAGFDANHFSSDFIATSGIEEENIGERECVEESRGFGTDRACLCQPEQREVVGGQFDQFGIVFHINSFGAVCSHEREVYAHSAGEIDQNGVIELFDPTLYQSGFVACCDFAAALLEGETRRKMQSRYGAPRRDLRTKPLASFDLTQDESARFGGEGVETQRELFDTFLGMGFDEFVVFGAIVHLGDGRIVCASLCAGFEIEMPPFGGKDAKAAG